VKKTHGKMVLLLAAGGLVLGGAWRYWRKELRHALSPLRFGVVEEGQLYRSGCIHGRLLRGVVEENGIGVIISLMGRYEPDEAVAKELGLELKQYLLKGNGTGDINIYADVIEDIVGAQEQGKAVLVHCTAGRMRTGAAVAFYRMLIQGESDSGSIVEEMIEFGWKPHRTVLPNYINENVHELARILKARGVIDEIVNPLPQIEYEGVKTFSGEEVQEEIGPVDAAA